MYTVYMHISPSGKKYVGITHWDVTHRWNTTGSGYKSQRLFYRAIQKYGWDNFQHIIIAENLLKEWACAIEQLLIRDLQLQNPDYGYNVYCGGEVGALGCRITDEAKYKMSIAHLGKKREPFTDDHKRKIGIANTGKRRTPEQRAKMSQAQKGLIRGTPTEETRMKISKSQMGRPCKILGKICVNDGIKNQFIYPDDLPMFLELGYNRGRLPKQPAK